MTGLTRKDVTLGTGSHVHVIGKGRKERCTPLAKPTVAVLKAWLCEPQRGDGQVLFPNGRGTRLSADGVHYLLVRHCTAASRICPSLKDKRVTVHVLRHTMALDLVQAGVDRSVIALWLGHESVETTQIYLEATLAMKEQALAKTTVEWPTESLSTGRSAAALPEQPVGPTKLCRAIDGATSVLCGDSGRSMNAFPLARHSPGRGIVPPIPHTE